MLFNSYEFLFAFLPVTLVGFVQIGRFLGREAAFAWLVLASLFYYAWWNPVYVGLIVGSMLVNFTIGRALGAGRPRMTRRFLLTAGVIFNLSLLGYFKYANFFVDTAGALADTDWQIGQIVLPLAISFFTFQQIAYLADAWFGEVTEYSFLHYALFVTFFPQLIAGPIVHHREMMPQFMNRLVSTLDWRMLAAGCTAFSIGLFKKVVLADGIAQYASPVFAAASTGEALDFFAAWGGALAYTFQLYFDFSGYSDMAIGIALMFGVRLPLNFYSPYKATSIVEFWRRWHMTLSRFLRDYVYIPLGGNRKGDIRRYANLLTTMLLGGLWHGAGWTFVFWGGLHGVYLVVNHAWHWVTRTFGLRRFATTRPWRMAAWSLTFLAVVLAWVFFRAESFDGATAMLRGMSGTNGFILPSALVTRIHADAPSIVTALGIDLSHGGGQTFVLTWLWIGALLPLALVLPNTHQLLRRTRPTVTGFAKATEHAIQPFARFMLAMRWRPSARWALTTAVILATAILGLTRISEFLYFQF